MDECGLSEVEVARELKVDLSTIYRIRGEKRGASANMIRALVVFSRKLVAAGRATRPLDANDFFRLPKEHGDHDGARCPSI